MAGSLSRPRDDSDGHVASVLPSNREPDSSAAEATISGPISAASRRSRIELWLLELSPLDWLVATFFTVVSFAVAFGSGPNRLESAELLCADWTALLLGLSLTRGGILSRGSFASALVYRLTIFGTVVSSYFQLRVILPAVTTHSVDASIYAFDLRVFHVEPSLAWDRFVTPQTTEWFAFFYFGYFFLLALHVLPIMLVLKNTEVLARFALGASMVFCIGHMTYMLVPGYGPYAFLAGDFHHELTGGTFWGLVQEAVRAGGAQKDIFPSLHTAVPTYFALFSYRSRREQWPFRYTWPIVTFCAMQIICATMFLRWHYLVDIFAGLSLAFLSDYLSVRLVAWDNERRVTRGLSPAWHQLNYGWLVPGSAERAHARG